MDKFDTIADFVKYKEACPFCKTPLRCVIQNYLDKGQGIPILNAKLENDRFDFKLEHTTAAFQVKADVFIFIEKNTLMFDNFSDGASPKVDDYLVRQTFEEYRPHFQLYCPSKKCGLSYYISSTPIKLKKSHPVTGMWYIEPFTMYVESARVGKYIVWNDWDSNVSCIYSRNKPEAPPIIVPLMDFAIFGKEKLINRIKTLVTFS